MVKKLYLQSDNTVVVVYDDPDNINQTKQGIMTRKDFEDLYFIEFTAGDLENFRKVRTMNYEPDVPLFHIWWHDGTIDVYKSYKQHNLLQALHDAFELVKADEDIVIDRRFGTVFNYKSRDFVKFLKELSTELDIKPRIRRFKDIPASVFGSENPGNNLIKQYNITLQMCIDDAAY